MNKYKEPYFVMRVFAVMALVACTAYMIFDLSRGGGGGSVRQQFTTHKIYTWTYGGEKGVGAIASTGSYGEVPPDTSWSLMADYCGPGPVTTEVTCNRGTGCDYKTNCTPRE